MHAPERIDNDIAQGQLHLVWADATCSIDHAALRRACRCAECQFKRHHGLSISTPDNVRITTMEPAGYGVQLIFSDGHARGIFPWAYLASLDSLSSNIVLHTQTQSTSRAAK
ncbi:DUF971 domain-containing protein [Ralstonia flaminis]|uniref:Gamma-butyrobetaine hydroxylase-like N-terminal domain-containing protein n=1 Tax=Ralstonia flaminis TaxID=3058597 RepID=A0ABN9JKW9_9RALS|nr:DUF971 domain-containing protein [Ralstonia sp. LMG 18101]CAJ0815785.1 hypothetical protein LMG18101_02702 [Ralstonia sp. LMG 18101]